MAAAIYVMCALTCAACAVLLARAYLANGQRLLFWSALCFTGLTLNNILLVIDKEVLAQLDLSTLRLLTALVSMLLLLFGLIWEEE